MTLEMLKAFAIIDKFERDYTSPSSVQPILVDLVEFYPARAAYLKAHRDLLQATLDYCRLTP